MLWVLNHDVTLMRKLQLENPVLRFQLVDLHLFVQFKLAVQSAHTPIEQLIKVHIAVVAFDSHFEHDLFHLILCRFLR